MDEQINEDLFDYLMCEISLLTVAKDGALVVRVTDEHYNNKIEDQYPVEQTERWDRRYEGYYNPGCGGEAFSGEKCKGRSKTDCLYK